MLKIPVSPFCQIIMMCLCFLLEMDKKKFGYILQLNPMVSRPPKLTWQGTVSVAPVINYYIVLFLSDHHCVSLICAGEGGGEEAIICILQVDSAGPHIFLRSDSAGYY